MRVWYYIDIDIDIELERIQSFTVRKLYLGYTTTFLTPKVIYKFDVDWAQVCARLENLGLDNFARECLLSIVHKQHCT